MNKNSSFPVLVSDRRFESLKKHAKSMVENYKAYVYPTLHRFGLLDDEHIKKYLGCETAEEIYKDAMEKGRDKLLYAAKAAVFSDFDLWAPIRGENSPVESPDKEGFVFATLPEAEYEKRGILIKALSVKDGRIMIDEEVLLQASIIRPTDEQRKVYELVSRFCKELDEITNKTTYRETLFLCIGGKLRPNVKGIVGSVFCTEIRKRQHV